MNKMDVLEEAKEIMKKAGCKKAFATYGLELNDITEIHNYDENGESLELEKDITELVPTIEHTLSFDPEKPIACPINSSMNKYLEFSLKNRYIVPNNIDGKECERIEGEINILLEKYSWTMQIKN